MTGSLAQIIALIPITSSFFGYYMGISEGLNRLIIKQIKNKNPDANIDIAKLYRFTIALITLNTWTAADFNISVSATLLGLAGHRPDNIDPDEAVSFSVNSAFFPKTLTTLS